MVNQMEISKELCGLLACVKAEYMNRFNQEPSEAMWIALFDRADHHLLSANIQRQRQTSASNTSSQQVFQPSQAQIKYALDLGIENPSQYSREELSKKIYAKTQS